MGSQISPTPIPGEIARFFARQPDHTQSKRLQQTKKTQQLGVRRKCLSVLTLRRKTLTAFAVEPIQQVL
jgi:hypothetical protein